MKRHIILEREELELNQESASAIEAFKTIIEIYIPYVETEDNIALKKLEEEAEVLNELLNVNIKKEKNLQEEIENIQNNKSQELEIISKKIKMLNNEIEACLNSLKIKDETKIKNIDASRLNNRDIETFNDLNSYILKRNKLKEEFIEVRKNYEKSLLKKSLLISEERENLKEQINKNYEKQDEILEKIGNRKKKTTEEIYLDILNISSYERIMNIEVPDDGKFYAEINHQVILKGETHWKDSYHSEGKRNITYIDDIETLIDFLNIPAERNFAYIEASKNLKFQRLYKEVANTPAVINYKKINDIRVQNDEDTKKLIEVIKEQDKLFKVIEEKKEEYNSIVNKVNRKIEEAKEVLEKSKKKIFEIVNSWFSSDDSSEDEEKIKEQEQEQVKKPKKEKKKKNKGWFKW